MKKYMSFALALLLAASVLTACGETVSKDPEGLITDPTGPAATMAPMPTMTLPATEPKPETRPSHDAASEPILPRERY